MADLLDVLTLDEAKAVVEVGAFDVSKDAILAGVVSAVSRRLDTGVGPIVRRTVTDELVSASGCSIWLRRYPVSSFVTITEYQGLSPVVLMRETPGVAGDYLAVPYEQGEGLFSGELRRRSGQYDRAWYCGRSNIKATYVAGRFADTASVDPKFKQAAAIMLRNLWRSYEQSVAGVGEFDLPAQNVPRWGVPNAVKDLLAEEWQDMPRIG